MSDEAAAVAELQAAEPSCDFSTLNLPIEPGQWRDADTRIFLACFTILGQYVEDELGREEDARAAGHGDDPTLYYKGYRLHAVEGGDEEAIDLWLWYRDELPKIEDDVERDLLESYGGPLTTEKIPGTELYRLDIRPVREPNYPFDFVEDLKDRKLQQLMALRRTLWT